MSSSKVASDLREIVTDGWVDHPADWLNFMVPVLSEVAALLDEVVATLEGVEWTRYDDDLCCPWCGNDEPNGHTPDCRLSALISRLKREEAGK